MTLEELRKFDGREGRSAYVAIGNIIYDVSSSQRWIDGQHEGTHQAGQDLTKELKSAPHIKAVIERFPVIGKVEIPKQKPADGIPLLSIFIIAFVVLLMVVTYLI